MDKSGNGQEGGAPSKECAAKERTALDERLSAALMSRDSAAALSSLEMGADPNRLGGARCMTPLGGALDALGERLREAAAPCELGAGRDEAEGRLGEAVALVAALIDAGADPNGPYSTARSGESLHASAGFAAPTWLRFFHAFGGGLPSANFCALAGSLMSKMIAGGLDASAAGPRGLTPLHYSAGLGLVEVAAALLMAGASVAAQDEDGETPLHRAAKCGLVEAARLLLDAGADPLREDAWGFAAEDAANVFGGQAMASLFAPRCERARLALSTPAAGGPSKRTRL